MKELKSFIQTHRFKQSRNQEISNNFFFKIFLNIDVRIEIDKNSIIIVCISCSLGLPHFCHSSLEEKQIKKIHKNAANKNFYFLFQYY